MFFCIDDLVDLVRKIFNNRFHGLMVRLGIWVTVSKVHKRQRLKGINKCFPILNGYENFDYNIVFKIKAFSRTRGCNFMVVKTISIFQKQFFFIRIAFLYYFSEYLSFYCFFEKISSLLLVPVLTSGM